MQQKFKIGDKVKVLTKVYPGTYGTEGVITKVGFGVCIVGRNADKYPSDQYGHFGHDSWRYCFYEEELELVEDKPKTKFKAGDRVVCVRGNEYHNASPFQGEHYVVARACVADGYEYVAFDDECWAPGWDVDRFELVTDREVSNPEPEYVIGQEVYVSNDFNRYLRKGVLLDAIPRNGLMHVNIGGFDCFVEEERVYTKEMKGD